jgi:hypothetical protein
MKKWRKSSWVILCLSLVCLLVSGAVWAKSSAIVTVQKEQVISGDEFAAGQLIKNDGIIKGDMFFWGQNISSTGTIEGDAIGIGQDVNLSGNILGDVRSGGSTVTLSGTAGKNVTVIGGVIKFMENSLTQGNIIAFGGQINISGKIKGRTIIGGGTITLNGEFFGDVDVNNFDLPEPEGKDQGASLTVLPGTIIHGKLKFRGSNAQIQKGAQVADFQWIKSKITPAERQKREITGALWKFIKLLFTTAAYFLIGLLLLRLFRGIAGKTEQFAAAKPWNAMGYGLIALVSTIGALIVCILLLVLSLLMSPAFGLVFGASVTAGYIVLFYLATIPAAVWLGGILLKGRRDIAYRFGLGLVLINVGLFIVDLFGKLPAVGPIFPVLGFIVRFGAILLGAGALLYSIRQIYLAAKNVESC